MKTKFLVGILSCFLLASCATHKKCNDPEQGKASGQKLYSKRYKTALSERDSLCQLAGQLQKDTSMNGQSIRSLNKELNEKNMQYNALKQASGEQLAKLSDELTQKQQELTAKEKALLEREQQLKDIQKLLAERDAMLGNIMGTLRKALDAFPKDELNIVNKNGKIYVSMMDKLLFKSGSANVEPRGVDALQQLAPLLNNFLDIDIVIEGHTDNIPIKTAVFKDNWDLSTYRATSVLRILTNNKVNVSRLTASGKGEFSPVASNETVEGRAQNRRTEMILTPKLDLLFQLLEKH